MILLQFNEHGLFCSLTANNKRNGNQTNLYFEIWKYSLVGLAVLLKWLMKLPIRSVFRSVSSIPGNPKLGLLQYPLSHTCEISFDQCFLNCFDHAKAWSKQGSVHLKMSGFSRVLKKKDLTLRPVTLLLEYTSFISNLLIKANNVLKMTEITHTVDAWSMVNGQW